MITLSAVLSAAWRDSAGRFARVDAGNTLGLQLQADSGAMVSRLRSATPVRTGAARASWSASYFPTSRELRITNRMNYTTFLITGTRHMAPNPELAAAVEQIREDAAVSLHSAGVTISRQLTGG